jgi:[acyl-carrier-protein] S-malonyltransferase
VRCLLVCPGRGSYGASELGQLSSRHPVVAELDAFRRRLGRPALTELDQAPAFSPRLHAAGEHASLLTFACTAVDVAALSPEVEVVGVVGNSMGWYSALWAAGALQLGEAARLVETMGAYQANNVIGGQFVYPVVDEQWRPSAELAGLVARALEEPGVHPSIRLGGSVVLGVAEDSFERVKALLPKLSRGGHSYPLQLPLHSAFHTPLMAATAARAQQGLADLDVRRPATTMVDGHARVHRPWVSPEALRQYTLGAQVTEPFDFSACLTTAVGELGPESIVIAGPGDTLGAPVAQALITRGFRGLRDRRDFLEAQAGPSPLVISMARSDQRTRVASTRPDSASPR